MFIKRTLLIAVGIFAVIVSTQIQSAFVKNKDMGIELKPIPENVEIATFAGGCFWCIEAPFQSIRGVAEAVSGYAGGAKENAKYQLVASGKTKHREAVQVFFDPNIVSYEELVDLFWKQIDPTDDGGQFADRGYEYTTAIYYSSESQKVIAEKSLMELAESGRFRESIVTKIIPFTTFFPAEEYHQDYYKKAKDHYERYKKGSGRSGFIDENWAKEAALEASKD